MRNTRWVRGHSTADTVTGGMGVRGHGVMSAENPAFLSNQTNLNLMRPSKPKIRF